MTARKELFIKTKEALQLITELELVDLYRKQFESGKENYPHCYTAAFIKIGSIQYESMTEHNQEGNVEIEVILYCKDGWMDQHSGTADNEHGLIEIDLIDSIVEKLQFLYGDSFRPLQQSYEEENDVSENDLMSYRIGFTTQIYKKIAPKYQPRGITITTV